MQHTPQISAVDITNKGEVRCIYGLWEAQDLQYFWVITSEKCRVSSASQFPVHQNLFDVLLLRTMCWN